MALYKPPTKVATKVYTYLSLVTTADPEWTRGKFWDVEYEFAGKALYANPYNRGPYNDHSNVFPVGQPFGGQDALKIAGKAPTAGNPVPGLYQAVATGGWA